LLKLEQIRFRERRCDVLTPRVAGAVKQASAIRTLGGQADSGTVRQLVLDVVQAPVDVDGKPTRRDFQILPLPLAFDVSILPENAHAEPSQRANGDQRRSRQ
jgi:hypothetical protein